MSFRYLILHNFWWKLCSLALAIIIWMMIHYSIHNPTQNPSEQRTVHLPITVIKLPDDGRVYKVTPSEADVLIAGEEAVLRNMEKSNIKLYLDLTDNHAETTNIFLHADVPTDVTLVQILPVTVTVEKISP